MPFILNIVVLAAQLALCSTAFMSLSAFLHNTWWTAIPVLSFQEGFLIGLLYSCFLAAMSLTVGRAELGMGIFQFFFYLIVIPLLLPWAIDMANDNLITAFPDISYGTAFIFTLISLGFGAIGALLTGLLEAVNES